MRRIDRLFWICVIAAGLLLLFFPVFSKYLELKRSEEDVNRQLRDIDKKIQELEKESYLIRHDAQHLEQVMRDELKLVKPGEIVYKLVPEETDSSRIKTQPTQNSSSKKSLSVANPSKLANQ